MRYVRASAPGGRAGALTGLCLLGQGSSQRPLRRAPGAGSAVPETLGAAGSALGGGGAEERLWEKQRRGVGVSRSPEAPAAAELE